MAKKNEGKRFVIPLRIQQTKKKMFSLNLNQYRNLHYRPLNKLKAKFTSWFFFEYGNSNNPPITKCELLYTIYFPDNRVADVGNIGSIVDKFTADCLSKFGWIEDDNRRVVKRIVFEDGGIDRDNPRCELEVKTLI